MALPLDQVTVETFEPHIDSEFQVSFEDVSVTFVLKQATASPYAATGRTPFSLIFEGPADPALPQHIHHLSHEALGDMEIFLVPVGAGQNVLRYQAVFS